MAKEANLKRIKLEKGGTKNIIANSFNKKSYRRQQKNQYICPKILMKLDFFLKKNTFKSRKRVFKIKSSSIKSVRFYNQGA